MTKEIKYKEVNGTFYYEKTSAEVMNVLERVRQNKTRIRVYYGDIETGKNWNEENDVAGYIGRSTGNIKIPLLINNSRSMGGGSLLSDCIIQIKESKGKRVLYKAPNFKESTFEIKPIDSEELKSKGYNYSLYIDGKIYSNHKTEKKAQYLLNKLS